MGVPTAKTPVSSVRMVLLIFVWRVVQLTMAVLNFTSKGSGEQCATIFGISMMPTWCVANLVSITLPPRLTVLHTGRVQVLSGWMMLAVKEENHQYSTVHILGGEYKTVAMARMRVWFATIRHSKKKKGQRTSPTKPYQKRLILKWAKGCRP